MKERDLDVVVCLAVDNISQTIEMAFIVDLKEELLFYAREWNRQVASVSML
jgi:hypothetical protein